ncbi:MAG: UvrD-helicase domain-containing protein [Alistipes sp.]|nr:UvrD-helicase domain-containing protein [Alistipes sp.]
MTKQAQILNASAGSGKTYQLAYNYVREIILQPTHYRHILAVTFTNKATEEMKSRILKEIHRLAADYKSSYRSKLVNDLGLSREEIRKRACDARSRILHDYSRFTVLTIDTFFQRILRAFIKELGIDLDYNIELETASILAKSADTLIEQITTNRELLAWLSRFVEERIEEGKGWDVRDGILSLGNELFKEKNKQSLLSPHSRDELAALVDRATRHTTATKAQIIRLAGQAMDAIKQAGGSIENFPYKYTGFANWFLAITRDGAVIPYTKRVATACEDDQVWGRAGTFSATMRPTLQPILQQMRAIYDQNLRAWNTCALLRETYRSFALLSDLYNEVQRLCDEQQLMLLSETKYLLSEFVTELDAPFIYEKVGNRYEHFMIDEFQDTSVKEWENFLPLLRNAMSQNQRQSVLLVGDIKQSIYRWRGSDWKILHERAAKELGVEHTQVINLKENFRSLPEVVQFNNRVISRLVAIDNTLLNSQLDEAVANGNLNERVAASLRDTLHNAYLNTEQIPRRKNRHEGYVSVEEYDKEPPIIARICELIDRGFKPADLMILVRTTREGAEIATQLLKFKGENQDPHYRFDVMTREALIIGTAPISGFITSVMRLALNPGESIYRALYNQYLGYDFDRNFEEQERLFLQQIRLLSPEEAFERIVLEYALHSRPTEIAYLQALHEQVILFCNNRVADLKLFLTWWDEQGATKSISVEESQTTIEITTIHKAKGLEKRVIIIPYCCWSLNPATNGATSNIVWAEAAEGDVAELGRMPIRFKQQMGVSGFSAAFYHELIYSHVDNINLLYVALTRAAESLHVFIPSKGDKHIGSLLRSALQSDSPQSSYTFGSFEGPAPEDERNEEEPFEQLLCEEPKLKPRHMLLDSYHTSPTQLQLRLPSERYFDRTEEQELSPRNFGILMHKAFEEAEDRASIDRAIDRMQLNGVLNATDAQELKRIIEEALNDPIVGSWFDGSWSEVRTEEVILAPEQRAIHRPDRVMVRGKEAVVIDYKFGEKDAERYRSQCRRYARLLHEMGYEAVKGYLWYVKQGKIEQVI